MTGRKDMMLTLVISSDDGAGYFISDSLEFNKEDLHNGLVASQLTDKAINLVDIVVDRLLRRTK